MNNKIFKNASWIIICKIIQSILSFIISMMTARYLGPSNYGLINYVASVVTFVVPVMELGITNILVSELVNNENDEGTILGTAITLNVTSSILCIIGVVTFVYVANHNEIETIVVCALYSFTLFFQAIDMVRYWFQANLLSKVPSIISLIAYFVVSVYKIWLLVTQKSVYWFAFSYTFDFAIIAVLELVVYKKNTGNKLHFDIGVAKRLFKRGKYYIISSMMVTIFAQTDKIMLKFMIDDTSTGLYSAASMIAGITSFVFAAIIDSAMPVILKARTINKVDFEHKLKNLYSVIIYLSLVQSLMYTLLAKPMILIIYGNSYQAAITPLRFIVWYTTFSYIGVIRNIWILAEEKQKYLWIVNSGGAICNVILNFVLIPNIGIIGAAIASVFSQFFTNVMISFFIKELRYNNHLMFESLNPKYFSEIIKGAYYAIRKKRIN